MPVARADSYRTVAFGAITGSFTAVGAAISHNWRMFRIVNNTNGDLIISFDAVNNNFFLPANSFILYDLTANTDTDGSTALVLALNTQFYVKYSSAPSSGSLYIEGIYAQGQ